MTCSATWTTSRRWQETCARKGDNRPPVRRLRRHLPMNGEESLGVLLEVRRDQLAEALQPAQRRVAAVGGDVPDAALDPGLRAAVDLFGGRLRVVGDRDRPTAGLL